MFLHSGNWVFLTSYKSGSPTRPGRALELREWALVTLNFQCHFLLVIL